MIRAAPNRLLRPVRTPDRAGPAADGCLVCVRRNSAAGALTPWPWPMTDIRTPEVSRRTGRGERFASKFHRLCTSRHRCEARRSGRPRLEELDAVAEGVVDVSPVMAFKGFIVDDPDAGGAQRGQQVNQALNP